MRTASVFLMGLLPSGGTAQTLVNIEAEPSCPNCSVELVKLATIGATSTLPTPSSGRVVRDSAGRFYFLGGQTVGTILQYSPDGQFLRAIGQYGEGPGEFRMPSHFVTDGRAQLYAYDPALRRVS